MAEPTLPEPPVQNSPGTDFHTVHRDSSMRDSVVRAIVHLNFNEPDQARDVLLDALTDFNFGKEVIYGNAAA